MSEQQKVIKNIAIVIACIFSFTIIETIIFAFITLSGLISDKEFDSISDIHDSSIIKGEPSKLRIDVSSVNLSIKEGNEFKIETTSNHIKLKENSTQLYIKEINHSIFKIRVNADLVVYIPKDYIFEDVDINNGTGKISLEYLASKNFTLDVGAGKINIHNLLVTENAKVDSGAGKTVIDKASIHNLNLNVGVGTVTLTAKLTGNNEIDAGVGSLNINLLGTEEDYKIKVDKGIGTCKINGNSISDNTYYGEGNNIILIDGGIGSIKVNTEKSIDTKKTFTKTYTVLNKTTSNQEDMYYVTLQVFQGEVDTVLINDKDNILVVDGTYEFTFERENKNIDNTIESIFKNTKIIDIKRTNKEGLDQIQEF